MEAIANMFHQLQETLNSELDTITSVVTEEEKDVINNIKLNTAAKISEIKLLISSCERVGSIRFDAQNKIKFYRNDRKISSTAEKIKNILFSSTEIN